MFRLKEVQKAYHRHRRNVLAFRADDLEIASGEYVAVIGPSGSGKTTFLSLLGGMLSPDSGEVWFDSHPLYKLSVSARTHLRRDRIGFVFQTFNLLPYLTALENVQVPLLLAGMPRAQQRVRAAALLEQLGLGDRLDHKPCELSTGQQQRTALARTLANDPSVILADEPTGNLDPESRAHVLAMFDAFVSDGRTVVMVTHDPAAAQKAKRRIALQAGQVLPDHIADKRRVA